MQSAALRVCLDANVWMQHLIALTHHRHTVATVLVRLLADTERAMPIQLIVSHELLDTLRRVLVREGFQPLIVDDLLTSIERLAQIRPEHPGPTLLISGRDQFAITDREDAGVFAACVAQRADLLVTDNLKDFQTNDTDRLDTRKVHYRNGDSRQLFALVYGRPDNVSLVIMHPLDAAEWLTDGHRPTAKAVRERYFRANVSRG